MSNKDDTGTHWEDLLPFPSPFLNSPHYHLTLGMFNLSSPTIMKTQGKQKTSGCFALPWSVTGF